MRILQINTVCGIRSTGRIATDIEEILLNNGHESYIAFGRLEAKNCRNSIRIGRVRDIFFHFLLTRIFDKHGFGSKKATKIFIEQVEKINPDIIHLHNVHGYYLNIDILFDYLNRFNKKVVWTLHDCWPFTGHCSHFDYIGCYKWKVSCNNCPQKKMYPKSILFDASYANYLKKRELFTSLSPDNIIFVTPSHWLLNILNESFLKEYRKITINNGIDLGSFYPRRSNLKEKYKLENRFIVLGVASTWSSRKGLEYFINLSQSLDDTFAIILIGINKQLSRSMPVNITCIEEIRSLDEIAEFYSMADVFLNPTLQDTFPTTNLESLACGTPVITFNTGGSPESIDDITGITVRKGDNIALIEALNLLKNSPLDRQDCVNRAKHFNRQSNYEKYIKIYSILGKFGDI